MRTFVLTAARLSSTLVLVVSQLIRDISLLSSSKEEYKVDLLELYTDRAEE